LKCIVILLLIFLCNLINGQDAAKYKKVLLLMGSRFEIIAVSEDSILARKSINAAIVEVQRIEKLISSWYPASQTTSINNNAGIHPVKVSIELYKLIKRCKKISGLTNGIFDISYASMDKIWKFDGSMKELPESSMVAASVAKINFRDIVLDENKNTVFLKNRGMKIGFGAIGKGYAANRAKKKMYEMGIKNGVVNAGGDLITWGIQDDGRSWQIAVTDPKDKTKNLGWLDISDMAVVTSGNYEKFVEFNDRRYSHIINPKTGYPAFGTRSVTILCIDAELADALATATFILGKKDGLNLINKLKGVECLIVTENDELVYSSGLEILYH
jgi:FAD:protein FMN transferase